MGRTRTKVVRAPGDVSPKVIAPAAVQFLAAVLLAVVTGDVDTEEIAALSAALVTALVGYFTTDELEV